MYDEQDEAEALDDDKGAFPRDEDDAAGIDLLDQTADADPGVADEATSVIDDGESGNDLEGIEADRDDGDDPFHLEEPAPEVAAMHVVDEGTQA